MNITPERQLNQDAYKRMRETIKQTYPHGRFVAIHGGQIVADAGDFETLHKTLLGMGLKPPDVLVVQAGVEHPEKVIIFM